MDVLTNHLKSPHMGNGPLTKPCRQQKEVRVNLIVRNTIDVTDGVVNYRKTRGRDLHVVHGLHYYLGLAQQWAQMYGQWILEREECAKTAATMTQNLLLIFWIFMFSLMLSMEIQRAAKAWLFATWAVAEIIILFMHVHTICLSYHHCCIVSSLVLLSQAG